MTATSFLFIITRWTMVANALVQFAPITETTFDFILWSHMSDVDIFLSDCEALDWAIEVLYFAGYIEIACK